MNAEMVPLCQWCKQRPGHCVCGRTQPGPPRPRSVVGTTVLVLITIFVIVPGVLLGAGGVLAKANETGGWLAILLLIGVVVVIAATHKRH